MKFKTYLREAKGMVITDLSSDQLKRVKKALDKKRLSWSEKMKEKDGTYTIAFEDDNAYSLAWDIVDP